MKNKNISNIALDTIDKINLAQVDIRFLSNILTAWDVDNHIPNHNDMFALSRLCDNISLQLDNCEKEINTLVKR